MSLFVQTIQKRIPHFNQAKEATLENVVRRTSTGKPHFPSNPTPRDHLLFLHGDNPRHHVGLRRLGKTFNETKQAPYKAGKFSASSLAQWINQLAGESNVYLTQSSFFWGQKNDPNRHRTSSRYLSRLSVLFIDLDCYNTSYAQLLRENPLAVAAKITTHCHNLGIAPPLIMHSGNGLYAYWALDRDVYRRNPKQIALWQDTQMRLMSALKPFGPDHVVKDLTRVLRLVGTVNAKSGCPVSVLIDDGRFHDLQALNDSVAAFPRMDKTNSKRATNQAPVARRAKKTQQPTDKSKSKPSQVAQPPPIGIDNRAFTWLDNLLESDKSALPRLSKQRRHYYELFADICKLVKMRGGIAKGQRDEVQFWLLVTRYLAGFYTANELPYLAERFSFLTQGRLNIYESGALSTLERKIRAQDAYQNNFRAYRSVARNLGGFKTFIRPAKTKSEQSEKKPSTFRPNAVYTPRVKTLIDRLGVTEKEQIHLKRLIGEQEKARRRNANSRRAKIERRNANFITLIEQGVAIKKAAKKCNISLSSAYRVRQQSLPVKVQVCARARLAYLHQQNPSWSVRNLAAHVGAATSTAHRWLCEIKQQIRASHFEHYIKHTFVGGALARMPAGELALTANATSHKKAALFTLIPLRKKHPLSSAQAAVKHFALNELVPSFSIRTGALKHTIVSFMGVISRVPFSYFSVPSSYGRTMSERESSGGKEGGWGNVADVASAIPPWAQHRAARNVATATGTHDDDNPFAGISCDEQAGNTDSAICFNASPPSPPAALAASNAKHAPSQPQEPKADPLSYLCVYFNEQAALPSKAVYEVAQDLLSAPASHRAFLLMRACMRLSALEGVALQSWFADHV